MPRVKFYKFEQNNSGGSFVIKDDIGIGPSVWIEATDPAHANARAGELGIYFDGVRYARDCGCCGDRWYPINAKERGEKLVRISRDHDFTWHKVVYVHKLDGTIERVDESNDAY